MGIFLTKIETMKKLILNVVVLCLAITYNANAQISAIVVDKIGVETLKNANVALQNKNDTTISMHSSTKDNGGFDFNNVVDGNYILSISYVGYKMYSAGIVVKNHTSSTLPDTIRLTQTGKDLQGVVVTSRVPFVEFKADKIIMNVAESPIAAGGNAYDVIKRAPGVVEQSDALSFRGKKILVLINDKPTYLSSSDLKEMLTNMPASNIDKVEILPTPSAKYDADAQSIINIKLAKNKNYGLNGSFTSGIGIGRSPRYNEGVNLNYRYAKLNIYGGYNYEHNQTYYNTDVDRLLTPANHIFESGRDVRTRNNNAYKLGLDYDVNKNSSFGFLFNGYTNHRDMTVGTITTSTHIAPLTDSFSNVAKTGSARFQNSSANLYYKTTFDTLGKILTLNADYLNYSKQWSDDITTQYYDINKIEYQAPYLLRDLSPSNNNVYAFSADYVNPIKNGSITAGIKSTYTITDNNVLWQYQNTDKWLVDANLTNHFKYMENVNAAYVGYDKTWGKYELGAGLRAEQTNTQGNSVTLGQIHDSSYLGFFPSISFQYTKNNNNVFALSYRKSVQRPPFEYVNPFIVYQTQYSYFTGNPYLKPEYDHDISLTYTYKQAWNFNLDYTHAINSINLLILNGSNNAVGTSFGNIQAQDQIAFSESWSHRVQKFWDISSSNNLIFNKYSQLYADGTQLDNSRLIYIGQLGNMFTLGKGWTAQLNANYHSAMSYGVSTVNGNFYADMGLQKSIMKNKAKLALSFTDIFNSQKLNTYTNFNGVNETSNTKPETSFIRLQFSYKFGNKNVKPKAGRASSINDINKRLGGN